MATAPQINKSASLEDKRKHIIKHCATVPMLNMLIKNKLLKLEDLDQDATDEVLIANSWLSLDEVTTEDLIIDKMGSQVLPVTRTPASLTDGLASKGYQATQGMNKMTFSFTIMVHQRYDTDALAQELTDLMHSKETIQIG